METQADAGFLLWMYDVQKPKIDFYFLRGTDSFNEGRIHLNLIIDYL